MFLCVAVVVVVFSGKREVEDIYGNSREELLT